MAILGFDLDEISRLLALVEQSQLDELTVEEGERLVRIRGLRRLHTALKTDRNGDAGAPSNRKLALSAASPDKLPENHVALVSPVVGIYYRSDKPGGTPLIDIGHHVAAGDAIGIIEAMKIFSEVLADHSGTVVAIPGVDGELVQLGAPLVIVRTD